jgi:hypothetical protein
VPPAWTRSGLGRQALHGAATWLGLPLLNGLEVWINLEINMHVIWRKQAVAVALGIFLTGTVMAQDGVWQGQKVHPMLRASLKNKEKNSEKHAAEVEVETQSIALVNLGISSYAANDLGVLEYQVDQGPVLATADTLVMFRDLTPGKHVITISLVNTDYKELGAKAELEVDIP